MKISELAAQSMFMVDATDPCEKALRLMQQLEIRHLPVLDGKKVIGMLSERDLLFHLFWLGSEGEEKTVHRYVATGATQVGEIVSTPLISIPPDTTVREAIRLMLEYEVKALPLVQDERLVGLVTKTDLLRYFAQHKSPDIRPDWRRRPVRESMATELMTVGPMMPTVLALRLMGEEHIRHFPVLEYNQLVGIVSDRDIFRGCFKDAKEEWGQPIQDNLVRDVMSRQLETVNPSTPLAEAAFRIVAKKIGTLPVLEGRKLVGLLSEIDLLEVIEAACESSQ